jgi:hypothetical protein
MLHRNSVISFLIATALAAKRLETAQKRAAKRLKTETSDNKTFPSKQTKPR